MTLTNNKYRHPEKHEVAWVTGLLEGEGSFMCTNRKGRPDKQLWVAMMMTDEDVVRKVHAVFGLGTVSGPYVYKNKPVWAWRVTAKAAAMTVMGAVWPYMGERRREKIHDSLLKWRTLSP